MTIRIQLRGDAAAVWALANPVLAERELALETDTLRYKIGDGSTPWNAVPYRELTGNFAAMVLSYNAEPSPPEDESLILHSDKVGGRSMAHQIGASGIDTALQPFLGQNKVGLWLPPGGAATVPGVTGYTALTAVGTATTRAVATSNLFQRMRRLGYVSAATAAALAGGRVNLAQITVGDGAGLGGFFKVCRFGISVAVLVTDARMFVGIGSASAPSNVEPATLTNSVGVGVGAADQTLKLFYGGTTAQAPIDLGPNFPANTLSVDAYELALFSPWSQAGQVRWEVTRLNTGHRAAGVINDGGGGVTLPSPTTLVSYMNAWRCNNATLAAVGLDLMSDYIETDY